MVWHAHSANEKGEWHLLSDHLEGVSRLAGAFASEFGAGEEGRVAGVLHDLGKYGAAFQARLRNEVKGVDHWSSGAWAALMLLKARGVGASLSAQGHHLGLQQATKSALRGLQPECLSANHPNMLKLPDEPLDELVRRLEDDGLNHQGVSESLFDLSRTDYASSMVDVRMLFSALVDADFLDTEAHFRPEDRSRFRQSAPLDAKEALKLLLDEIHCTSKASKSSGDVKQMRTDLLQACLRAGETPQGAFTLSAPTGSGKTFSMLAFALRHCLRHRLKRIVLAVPFLSIIDQTAQVYRNLFEPRFGPHFIIEDHSLAGNAGRKADNPDDEQDENAIRAKLLAENWDAPIVLTTTVRLLESLHSNRPGAARRLHNLARSVVLFDEAQTLPPNLAVLTLSSLSRLVQRYGTSVVFATATQPAFSSLSSEFHVLNEPPWETHEIVAPAVKIFSRKRRVRVEWGDPDSPTSWRELARNLAEEPRALCIVNLKRHAQTLVETLRNDFSVKAAHLSTNMCPKHRESVIRAAKAATKTGKPFRLISTQCVEAGVDIDFPVVYRAWAALDAIAQAAGRCNRNGNLPGGALGRFVVFAPESEDGRPMYPSRSYAQATKVAVNLCRASLKKGTPPDIEKAETYEEYYREYYSLTGAASLGKGRSKELAEAVIARDFAEVAALYRLIPQRTVNILVQYRRNSWEPLLEEVRENGLSRDWIRRARPYTVNLHVGQAEGPLQRFLEPLPIKGEHLSDEWFFCFGKELYDENVMGLVPPEGCESSIA